MIAKLLFIVFLPFTGSLQNVPAEVQQTDSSAVSIRTVDAQTLQKITNDPIFEYNEVPKNPDSLLSRLQRWVIQLLQYLFQNPWAEVFLKVVFFAIFAVVLIALINNVLGGNISGAFTSSKAGESISLNISEQELSETNYNELLEQARREQRFSDAIRLMYLKSLQQLSEAGLIVWKADKTNHDYLNELSNHPAKPHFSRLTYFYEFVEYGDFSLQKDGFSVAEDLYQKFNHQISA